MLIVKSFKIHKKWFLFSIFIVFLSFCVFIFYSLGNSEQNSKEASNTKKDFIKWVDFNVTAEALNLTAKLDIDSHNNNEDIKYNWIELLAYLACNNGGDFKNFKKSQLDALVSKLESGETIASLTR